MSPSGLIFRPRGSMIALLGLLSDGLPPQHWHTTKHSFISFLRWDGKVMNPGSHKTSYILYRRRVIAEVAQLVLQSRKVTVEKGWCAETSCYAVLHFTGYCQQICQNASCFYNVLCFVMLWLAEKLISWLFFMAHFCPNDRLKRKSVYLKLLDIYI